VEDQAPGRLVHDPSHPDADPDGNVFYPNVDLNDEMVDLMLVRRIHEANVTAFQAAKQMLRRAIDI
jgi:flagellar basal-body rod protein FlgC